MAVKVRKPCSHGANRASRKVSVSGFMAHRLKQRQLLYFDGLLERHTLRLADRPVWYLDRLLIGFGSIQDVDLTTPGTLTRR